MSDAADLLAVVQAVVAAFERHYIPYFITGSFASSVHGEFRATNDLDLVAALQATVLDPLIADLSHAFSRGRPVEQGVAIWPVRPPDAASVAPPPALPPSEPARYRHVVGGDRV